MRTILCIAASIVAGQYFWLSDSIDAYAISLNAQLFIAWALVFCFIPYARLMEKSAAFIFALSYIADVFSVPIIVNVVMFGSWILWAIYRPYTMPTEKVSSDYVYWCAHKPDNFIGFLHSLIDPKPLGGYGICTDGIVYIYRHGEFQAVPIDNMPLGMIYIKAMKRSDNVTAYLTSKVGSRWGFRNNCIVTRMMCNVYAR